MPCGDGYSSYVDARGDSPVERWLEELDPVSSVAGIANAVLPPAEEHCDLGYVVWPVAVLEHCGINGCAR